MGEFEYESHRTEYDEYGEGERLLVLAHGLRAAGAELSSFLAEVASV